MEENIEKAISTQKKLQSSQDPGWNDPPSWALAAPSQKSSSATPTKSRLMNRRVAFPLTGPVSAETQRSAAPATTVPPITTTIPTAGNLPPSVHPINLTTAPHKPRAAPTKVTCKELDSDVDIDRDEALRDTMDNLHCAMEQLNLSKKDEINKRLDRMEKMWNENKLNKVVYQKLLEISKALKAGEVEKADQQHILLMMNNASICSSWMPGIRQIITETKTQKL